MPTNPMSLMAQFADQPALIEEGRSAWLQACLAQVAEKSEQFEKMDCGEDFWPEGDEYSYLRPYKVKDGILHVPVRGVLMNNFPYAFGSWATGYEYIWAAVKRGVADPAVKGIALVIDSGGGMVAGNFDLNDRLYSMRGTKPIRAYACEHAYSAAYSIASCADTITVARTGGVGSIGVVVVHMEQSKMLENYGITTTIIRSKPGKMEGNAYEALSEEARGRIEERVNEFHDEFAALVARNRGMEVSDVDSTDALTFMPQQAIDNGLADAIGNFDDAITAFAASFNSEGNEKMADYTQAQYDEAVSAATISATTAGKTEGVTEGATTERTRISAIMNSDEGKKRPGAAMKIALNEKFAALDAASVSELLADMPEEKPKAVTPTPQTAKPTAGAPAGMLKSAMKTEKKEANGIVAEVEDEDEDPELDAEDQRAANARAMIRTRR